MFKKYIAGTKKPHNFTSLLFEYKEIKKETNFIKLISYWYNSYLKQWIKILYFERTYI